MPNVYDQHRASFATVSAYVVLDLTGERVANVAVKYPRDGAGRVYCYFHVFGAEMARGFANGYGYDKCSAAAESAVARIKPPEGADWQTHRDTITRIKTALAGGQGVDWARRLQDAGYLVIQAV
jgi:hypothetical protein